MAVNPSGTKRRKTGDDGDSSVTAVGSPPATGGNSNNHTPRTDAVTNQGLAAAIHPHHASATKTVTPPQMVAMMELTADIRELSQTLKAVVKTKVKTNIWQLCKLPDHNSRGGERMKVWFENQLHLGRDFEGLWKKKDDGIKCQINDTLRIQRAYVLQQMKGGYYCALLVDIPGPRFQNQIIPHVLFRPFFCALEAFMHSIHRLDPGDSLKTAEELSYSRADFLRYNVGSVQSAGNKKLFERLKKLSDDGKQDPLEIEKWEKMKNYPAFEEVNLANKDELKLLAWVVETFMAFVCKKPSGKEDRARARTLEFYNALFDHMTLDDLVFMFVQAQNNINKWKLVWEAFQEKIVPAWKDHESPEDCECTKKSLKDKPEFEESLRMVNLINSRGYECPQGSGIAGRDGRRRYNNLTEHFWNHYYNVKCEDSKATVENNRKALIDAVVAFATKMRKGAVPLTQEQLEEGADENARQVEKPHHQSNAAMCSIDDDRWDAMFAQTGVVSV